MILSNSMKLFVVISMVFIGYYSTTLIIMVNNYFFNKEGIQQSQNRSCLFIKQQTKIEEQIDNQRISSSNHDHLNKNDKNIQSITNDYPFEVENNYQLFPNDEFEITLVTYVGFQEREFIQSYCQHWNGPIVIILYYKENESNLVTNFISTNSIQRTNVNIIPIIQESTVAINHLKNLGIQNVQTTHFLFAEFNLIPSKSLYSVLKSTPGYLWRDKYFVGVIPAFEWSSEYYDQAKQSFKRMENVPSRSPDLNTCIKDFTCRPIQTTTIPMQFTTFSFLHYRNMNCIDENTELYVVLKKSDYLPLYDESITERGYDNVAYIEMLRRSCINDCGKNNSIAMKFGLLADEFLFRVPGIGVSSDVTFANWKKDDLKNQYQEIIDEYAKTEEKINPTTLCNKVEGAMYSWIGFSRYIWLDERTIDGIYYPKVGVKKGKKDEVIV